MEELFKLEIKNSVALLIINRPDKLNSLSIDLLKQLKINIEDLEKREDVGSIVITGAGEKAFVAGADILEINKLDAISARNYSDLGQTVFNQIENLSKPVIAAINGFALGGGCELALCCHIRFASEKAKMGLPETGLGLIPGFGGTQRLPRLIGKGRAMELILSGEIIDALEAFRIGLVNKVFPIDELIPKAIELAEKINMKSKYAIKNGIKSMNLVHNLPLLDGLNFEKALFAQCCGTDEFIEGTTAFLEKRKPNFKISK